MSEPILLTALYSPVMVSNTIHRRLYEQEWLSASSADAPNPTRHRRPVKLRRADAFIEEHSRVAVLGSAGSGKTTLLRHVALAMCDNVVFRSTKLKTSRFPFFVDLPKYARDTEGAKSIADYLSGELEQYTDSYARYFVHRVLNRGLAVLVLDSLDEVPPSIRKAVVEQIRETATGYPKCRMVVSCRTADYEPISDSFYEVEIARLTQPAIRAIVKAWFKDEEKRARQLLRTLRETSWVRLFFVEEFLPYSWAFLPADASLQCSVRGDSNQASAYPRLSGGQPSLETAPNTVGLSPSGALPSGHSRGVLVRFHGQGDRPVMAVTTGFQGRRFDAPEARTGVPRIDLPSPAPCAAADAVFADAKAFLSSNEARQMSESELERELHRRGQKLVRKLLQGHHDQRSPGQAAGPAEDASGVECSARREQDSHAETTSGTMQVVGLGCARRGHDGLHPLDAALNLLPERSLVDMRRRVTIATASRAPPRTPWKPQWYSTLSTWQRRCGVRCSSPAH